MLLDSQFALFFKSRPRLTDLQAVLRQSLVDALERDREQHLRTPPGRPVYTQGRHDVDPLDADLEAIDLLLGDAKEALARRDAKTVRHLVDELLTEHSLPETARAELSHGLLQVMVQSLQVGRERVLEGVTGEIAATRQAPPKELPVAPVGPLLSELLPAFMDHMTRDQGWKGQTIAQNNATYEMFLAEAGDLPVQEYGRLQLGSFYETLRRLPAMYAKKAAWRQLPLREVVALCKNLPDERLSMKTIKRHFSALGRLFAHLREQGQYVGDNPAYGFKFPTRGRQSQARQMWEGLKLSELFASPIWSGCKSSSKRGTPGSLIIKDEKYWLPLLALFHGNRLEEFAQLIRSDVRCEDGIHYLDINDDDEKQVKNEQSKRRVPIHPELVRIGFLEYVEKTAPIGSDSLFPEMKPGGADNKLGHAYSKWWTRYRKAIGLYEKGLDYHSFRHGVTTKLFAAEVPRAIVDELTGHEGQGTSQAVYNKGAPLAKLHEAISKVSWPEVIIKNI